MVYKYYESIIQTLEKTSKSLLYYHLNTQMALFAD